MTGVLSYAELSLGLHLSEQVKRTRQSESSALAGQCASKSGLVNRQIACFIHPPVWCVRACMCVCVAFRDFFLIGPEECAKRRSISVSQMLTKRAALEMLTALTTSIIFQSSVLVKPNSRRAERIASSPFLHCPPSLCYTLTSIGSATLIFISSVACSFLHNINLVSTTFE